jgi:hypothetical protein
MSEAPSGIGGAFFLWYIPALTRFYFNLEHLTFTYPKTQNSD